ncbi:MAG: hypothetical protein IKS37_00955 [Solobacterium sp.]|nr:hypothetical protein [Solobacterium sp.]
MHLAAKGFGNIFLLKNTSGKQERDLATWPTKEIIESYVKNSGYLLLDKIIITILSGWKGTGLFYE